MYNRGCPHRRPSRFLCADMGHKWAKSCEGSQRLMERKRTTLIDMKFGRWVDKIAGRQFRPLYSGDTWAPTVDCYEDDANFYIIADLAGVCPEVIDLEVRGEVLTISGTRPSPTVDQPAGDIRLHVMEIDHGRFSRDLPIPDCVDSDAISAVYRHGLLWVRLPKKV